MTVVLPEPLGPTSCTIHVIHDQPMEVSSHLGNLPYSSHRLGEAAAPHHSAETRFITATRTMLGLKPIKLIVAYQQPPVESDG